MKAEVGPTSGPTRRLSDLHAELVVREDLGGGGGQAAIVRRR
jgi:hypothetical protein